MAHCRWCYIFATVIKINALWDASSLLIILSDWLFSSESMRLGGLGPFISSAFWCGSWLESQLEVVEVEVTTRHQTGQRRSSHDNRLVIKFGTRCWGTMTCDDGGFWPLAFSFWQLIEKLKLNSIIELPVANSHIGQKVLRPVSKNMQFADYLLFKYHWTCLNGVVVDKDFFG